MSEKRALTVSMKTARRTRIIDQLVEALGSKDLLNTLDYRNKSEGYIKTYMHRLILERLVRIHKELSPGLKDETYL